MGRFFSIPVDIFDPVRPCVKGANRHILYYYICFCVKLFKQAQVASLRVFIHIIIIIVFTSLLLKRRYSYTYILFCLARMRATYYYTYRTVLAYELRSVLNYYFICRFFTVIQQYLNTVMF